MIQILEQSKIDKIVSSYLFAVYIFAVLFTVEIRDPFITIGKVQINLRYLF